MQVIDECIQSIKAQMDEIAFASTQQSEMITSVENRIKEVSKVIETNSDAAVESAAISNELSGQARTLNQLIGRFHIEYGEFRSRASAFRKAYEPHSQPSPSGNGIPLSCSRRLCRLYWELSGRAPFSAQSPQVPPLSACKEGR